MGPTQQLVFYKMLRAEQARLQSSLHDLALGGNFDYCRLHEIPARLENFGRLYHQREKILAYKLADRCLFIKDFGKVCPISNKISYTCECDTCEDLVDTYLDKMADTATAAKIKVCLLHIIDALETLTESSLYTNAVLSEEWNKR